jgi:hypothetical protein
MPPLPKLTLHAPCSHLCILMMGLSPRRHPVDLEHSHKSMGFAAPNVKFNPTLQFAFQFTVITAINPKILPEAEKNGQTEATEPGGMWQLYFQAPRCIFLNSSSNYLQRGALWGGHLFLSSNPHVLIDVQYKTTRYNAVTCIPVQDYKIQCSNLYTSTRLQDTMQ